MKTKGGLLTSINPLFYTVMPLIILMFFHGGLWHRDEATPTARDGVLDLRCWDFGRQGSISLDGEWEFYWQQLLTPGDFSEKRNGPILPRLTGKIEVPSSWQGYLFNDQKLGGSGFATYRLQILLPNNDQPLGLGLQQLYTAYELWANGRLIASAGKVGDSRKKMTPQFIQKIILLQPTSGLVELVIPVSNFHHRRGGIWRPLQLGLYSSIKRDLDLERTFVLFVLGGFILMAFYHLNLYFYIKRDSAPLFFSLFFALGALRAFLVGQLFYTQVFPNFPWEVAIKLEYFTFYYCAPVLYSMLHCLYPAEIPARSIRPIYWIAYLFTGITILTPARVYSHLISVSQLIFLVSAAYMLVLVGKLSKKRHDYLMFTVLTFIFFAFINDVLFYNKLTRAEFPMMPFLKGLIPIPSLLKSVPFGFIYMIAFILFFYLLTLQMTRHYFLLSGLTEKEAAAAIPENSGLTPREVVIIPLLIKGYSNKEIASRLYITEGTVKNHLHNIYQKTGAKNRTELSHLLKI